MENKAINFLALFVLILVIFISENAFALDSYGTRVNTLCAPQQPFTGDCSLCHTGSKSNPTPGTTAYKAGGTALLNYFCPTPSCTDNDGDTFSQEGGDCGVVDCNDGLVSVYPGAPEICGDNVDQDCNGSDLVCPQVCTDNDGDTFSQEGGDCGAVDCNDGLVSVYPGAPEICGDNVDQDCNGLDKSCSSSLFLVPIFHLLGLEQ